MCLALPTRSISLESGIAVIFAAGPMQRAGLVFAGAPPDRHAGGA